MSRPASRRPRKARIAAVALAAVLALAGCTGDDDSGSEDPDGADAAGVLQISDLGADGWATVSEEGAGSLCSGLSSTVSSVTSVADAGEATFARDSASVLSTAWVAREGSGSRRHDFDRIRGAAQLCGPSAEPGDDGIVQFEIEVDEADRFVVTERRTVRGVAGGADQLYFREGPIVGVVIVAFEGGDAPLSVLDLEDEARVRARELERTPA